MPLREPSEPEPTPAETGGAGGDDLHGGESRPDWLTDAGEGTRGEPQQPSDAQRPGPPPHRPPGSGSARPPSLSALKLVPGKAPVPGAPDASGDHEPSAAPEGRVAWKAAASSIPKLSRVSPVAIEAAAEDPFPGFAQDAVASGPGAVGVESAARRPPPSDSVETVSRRLASPPPWEAWIDRLRTIPPLWLIGAGIAVATLVVTLVFLSPPGGISLAQIRQHPEAFEGRAVEVRGRAGETFSIGDSYVYDLRQARDTIVVFSHSRRPALHERVLVKGTVSIGYLDGEPRVAIIENPSP